MSFNAAEQSAGRYGRVRAQTEALIEGLTAEDLAAQAFAEASPAKWHLAHTSWFFETFVLAEFFPGHRPFNPAFRDLFNSYYDSIGVDRPAQGQRGCLTRPPLSEVLAYRRAVDQGMLRLLARSDDALLPYLDLGIAHEQQHQELILTDGLALFARNPLEPAWGKSPPPHGPAAPLDWIGHAGGMVEIGHSGRGFAFDNEGPRHPVLLAPFRLASRPVTNGEWQDFMADGGYAQPLLWQSDGWDLVRRQGWAAPEYWRRDDCGWTVMNLCGRHAVQAEAPVCHISWFEAEAYARWAGARLPDEAEWEVMAVSGAVPWGQVWEWTASPHRPYPGWRAPAGAFGEYNGKFMAGRMVCRGGSVATAAGHGRPSYRNFWWPTARWQFTGLRLAEDA
ncbi:MAG: ergothioneine biosynthesis protein EgtB [Magnetospirillum sp.]|nr:ergothioneine biosynthesis protein EgtB [Magnetospirillum sp.]